ncbi:hypothetical protein CYV19_12965 [Natronobacterium gregoryi SP2]|uniref:DUF8139 domain-containing protein n=1 Tax=Natronobacterium gregoryi (strain ATCC 43098 / DSM 3393 / CCM 3738 / CIP 104747 / IAM 13177 / JCM 8860 / NBRC 102187 / NCIMB 2189 / SP2) TaxID=797304 RepID=A0A2J4JD71_NATGS|nr:hypothetical protein CYV19_12965 [Natronobacterium gregoryi SP2]
MKGFHKGDRVRIDIPDETDPDHDRFHGEQGVVQDIIEDDAGSETGDPRDNILYQIQLNNGKEMGFRWRDLRPADTV